MYKIFAILLAVVLLSLGLTSYDWLAHQLDDSLNTIIDDDAALVDWESAKTLPVYDVPRPNGEPLPPPPDDDDEPEIIQLGPR